MKAEGKNTSGRRPWFIAWLFTVSGIIMLSAFGRPLQQWVFANLGKGAAAWAIGLILVVLGVAAIHWLIRSCGRDRWRSIVAIAAPMLVGLMVIITQLPQVEERLHFATFGIFGFATARIAPFPLAIVISLAGAAGDELFQAWLPDRVGDWRDVAMNTVASSIGLAAAWVGTQPRETE